MSGKVIAFANQKGGVGKTTISYNFAVSLANRGYKVLGLDFDSQGNFTTYCGCSDVNDLEYTVGHAIKDVIVNDEFTKENFKVYSIKPFKTLKVLPANNYLFDLKPMMLNATSRETLLSEITDPLKEIFDYIIIDCAPSLDIDLLNALVAADEIIIVSTPAKFSYDGSEQLLKTYAKIKKRLNPELEIAGVICNMVDNRNKFMPTMVEAMRNNWENTGIAKVFETEIPISVRVPESQLESEAMLTYEKNNSVTTACEAFVDEYLSMGDK